MFILRRITSEGYESNQVLGDEYSLIEKFHSEKYKDALEAIGQQPNEEEIYCLLIHNRGSDIIPLYRKSTYYIMTSNGQTFKNISFR